MFIYFSSIKLILYHSEDHEVEISISKCSCPVVGEYVASTCRGSVEAHKPRNVTHIPLHEIVEATGCRRPCYIISASAGPIDVVIVATPLWAVIDTGPLTDAPGLIA